MHFVPQGYFQLGLQERERFIEQINSGVFGFVEQVENRCLGFSHPILASISVAVPEMFAGTSPAATITTSIQWARVQFGRGESEPSSVLVPEEMDSGFLERLPHFHQSLLRRSWCRWKPRSSRSGQGNLGVRTHLRRGLTEDQGHQGH